MFVRKIYIMLPYKYTDKVKNVKKYKLTFKAFYPKVTIQQLKDFFCLQSTCEVFNFKVWKQRFGDDYKIFAVDVMEKLLNSDKPLTIDQLQGLEDKVERIAEAVEWLKQLGFIAETTVDDYWDALPKGWQLTDNPAYGLIRIEEVEA